MKRVELGKYVVSDPSICHGKLTFNGTRVLVEPVLAAFANGETIDYIVTKSWPTITKEAVEEALMLAINSLIKDYPGYHDQPWHDEVARQVEEHERRREERKRKAKKKIVEVAS
jgi:uncharacterized protein (DUF433 family)